MAFLINLLKQLSFSGILIIALIVAVFVLSFIINLVIRCRYIGMQNDLNGRQQRRAGIFRSELLNRIVEEYKKTAMDSYSDVNTQAIIEKCFNMRLRGMIVAERFVKSSVSMLIILGLLGTFLGLTISVGELVKIINQTGVSDFIDSPGYFITGLVSAVGGMAVAFITSLFGIACSIILTVLGIIFNAEEARETLMVNIEEYLDNTVALVVNRDKETEYTMLNRILKETFVEFGQKIENTLNKTVESFGDRLSHVVMDVHISSKALDSTVDKFDQSLKTFAQNIRDFSEFNFNLRNNIERMDVSLVKVTEALANTSKIVSENYSSLEDFSKDLRDASKEITSCNTRVVQDVGSLVNEVKLTVSGIKELGEALRSEIELRALEIRRYHDRFDALMNKLSAEIDMLGRQTADAFAKSLSESGKEISAKTSEGIQNVLREIFLVLDAFKENERMLAKTIAMFPDQLLAYNEAASSNIGRRLDEIKAFLSGRV